MLASLFLHPDMVLPLWRRALVGARQPARVSFRIDSVEVEGARRTVSVRDQKIAPLAVLTKFELDPADGAPREAERPAVLLTPPMAGGFAFILRDVVVWLLRRCDVYVLEWLNVAATPNAGRFTVDDQIAATLEAMRAIGRPAHLAGFCQGGCAATSAAAVAAEREDGVAPRSLTLVGAPLDARAAPSVMGEKIAAHGVEIYRSRRGGRRDPESGLERGVYPAEVQLGVVMNTIAAQNPETHEFSRLMLRDEGEDPDAAPFLEMATALMDLPWEHFRENIERLYLEERPIDERLRFEERPAPLAALKETPILAVEGERDALVSPGQCRALIGALPKSKTAIRRNLVVEKTGHFGLFYGDRWRASTAPAMWRVIQDGERLAASAAAAGRRASA